MQLRNIHFAAAAAITAPAVAGTPSTSHVEQQASDLRPQTSDLRLRTRRVSVSPLEEYQLRPGAVRPIPDFLAAVILSFSGRAEITANGIVVDRKKELGRRITYHHPDSVICNDLSRRERKWFYVLNRQNPDRVHILDENGNYVETLPEKFMPHALDNKEQAAVAAAYKRQIRRVASHLQGLQSEETEAAIENLRHNAETMTRYVQTFDAPASSPSDLRPPTSDLRKGGNLDRMQRGDRAFQQAAARKQSAASLGKALNASRSSSSPLPAQSSPLDAEDWSHHPRNLNAAPAPVEAEAW